MPEVTPTIWESMVVEALLVAVTLALVLVAARLTVELDALEAGETAGR
jgi:hypothetical protein